MSRAFVAFYMGDYDRDTQALTTLEHGVYFLLLKECWVHGSIPLEPAKRAKIAKLSLREWHKVAPTINPFFDADGCNKRATKEIEKADASRLRRAMAGQRGGLMSGIQNAIRRGKAEAMLQQSQSNAESNAAAMPPAQLQQCEANQRSNKITSTFSVAAREGAVRDTSAGSNAETPAGLAMKAREAVQQSSRSIGSGELEEIIQKRGWAK